MAILNPHVRASTWDPLNHEPLPPLRSPQERKGRDIPNFAAWSNENLANFAADAYIRMQEQAEHIERLRLAASTAHDLLLGALARK